MKNNNQGILYLKTIKRICLIAIFLSFSSKGFSQINSISVAGLKIGDQVPDVEITNILNYTAKTVKISDFKGKLVILDFWATWCAPCIAMIPKMDSLQKKFLGRVQFIPIAYQSQKEVKDFLTKYEKQNHAPLILPDVTDDTTFVKLFPHKELPHFVWIDTNGIVKAITDYDNVNEATIKQFLGSVNIVMKQKIDVRLPFDRNKPLLINGNGGGADDLLYHSLMASYKVGLPGTVHFDIYEPKKTRRVSAINQSVASLFATALGADQRWFGANKRIFLTKDSTNITSNLHGIAYKEWMMSNRGYSYELIVPPPMAKNIFLIMTNELERFFPQYDVTIQKMPVKCIALTRTSSIDKIHTKGGTTSVIFDRQGCKINNNYLGHLIARLDVMYLQGPLPIVDATNYNNPVDIELNANLSDLKAINAELKKYDLEFKESLHPVEMLVFRDKK